MSALGFTGTRRFSRFDLSLITPTMWSWFEAYDSFVTGACIGFDAIIGSELVTRFPDKEHVIMVPYDRSRVDPWWTKRRISDAVDIKVIEMPIGSNYRDRNTAIVLRSDALFYAANYPEKPGNRSGTWMTVNIARNHNLLITGVILHPLVP